MGSEVDHRRLRAPRNDGESLIEPPLTAVGELLATNAQRRAAGDYDLQGRSIAQLAGPARRQFVAAALRYTRQYRDVGDALLGRLEALAATMRGANLEATLDAPPILLAGHQPQLFHPGVWFKNFALSRLAVEHAGVGVNLLIDNDAVDNAAVRVPGGSIEQPVVQYMPLDARTHEMPYEERRIADRDTFTSFGRRATESIRPLVPHPLVETWWASAVRRAEENENLGQCLAQARHQLEGQWGLETLELPHSAVCESDAFCWFVAHLVAQLPRFSETYNSALADYRRQNGIRSKAHPVPNLGVHDDWLEAPFWVWKTDSPRRRRLFARRAGDRIVLSDLNGWELPLDLSPESDGAAAAEVLAAQAQQGVKIRTRAIATTMYARVMLGDLFLHGIGGAKYDELTDMLIDRFFGLQPPEFMVLSATCRLPVQHEPTTPEDLRHVRWMLRELTFHPEKHIDRQTVRRGGELGELERHVQAKRRWIESQPPETDGRARHEGITSANRALQTYVETQRERLLDKRDRVTAGLQTEAVLSSREYAFCLFPEERLRRLLLELSGASS